MATVAVDAKHGGLEIVHAKTFVPKPKPVMVVFSKVGFVIAPLPETNVHKPVPTIGVFAAIVVEGEEIQSVCVVPAFATVGLSFTRIEIVDEEGAHGGFEMVHSNTFNPNPNPVTDVVGDSELVIVPLPETKDHVPIPTVAVLAFINAFGLVMQTVWLNPAFEIVGTSLTVNATVELDEAHGGFEIVHANTFVPIANPVIEVVGDSEFVTTPVPETKVQTPIPTVAVFAVIIVVGEEIQSVCVVPAFETVGRSSTIIAIVDEEAAQGKLEIVHSKTFVPSAKPVIVELGEVGFEIVPLPEINVHKPVPTVGVFAVIAVVGDEIQMVCVVPAFETVGMSFTIKATVVLDAAQGALEMVHAKTFVPKPNPVIEVVGESEFVITPVPDTKVHTPTPTDAVLAVIAVVGEEIQSVCVVPALETVGISSTIMAIVEVDAAQGELEMVHAKIFVPKAKPVIEVVGEREFVIIPVPEIKVHAPTPTVAVFAVIAVVGDEIQMVCVVPAFETVGMSFTIKATVVLDAAQGALEMVHAKTFVPKPNPVIEVVGESEFVITPVPDTKVHTPTPTDAVLAVIAVVGEEIQSVCVVPALETVGISSTIMAIVEVDAAQGELEMVHAKIFVPKAKPVMEVVGESELVMVPLPETKVQTPIPTVAVLAVIVVFGLLMHNV